MRHAKRHYLCDTVEQQFTHLGYLAVKVVAGSNPVSEPSVSPTRVLAVHGLVAWCQPGARVWLTLTRFLTTAVRGRQHLPRAAVAYLIQVWI